MFVGVAVGAWDRDHDPVGLCVLLGDAENVGVTVRDAVAVPLEVGEHRSLTARAEIPR